MGIFHFIYLLLASVLSGRYYTTFTWVHACVKDGAFEHLHGVFIYFYFCCYPTAGERAASLSSMVLHGALAGHYILIPTVYTTIPFLCHFTIYLLTLWYLAQFNIKSFVDQLLSFNTCAVMFCVYLSKY